MRFEEPDSDDRLYMEIRKRIQQDAERAILFYPPENPIGDFGFLESFSGTLTNNWRDGATWMYKFKLWQRPAPLFRPAGWDPALAGDVVMQRLVKVTAPQAKGAHDAEFVCVGDRADIVEHDNDVAPRHGADAAMYCVLTVVNLKTLCVEKTHLLAKAGQAFANVTQSDHKGSSDRIMFGKLEAVGEFESQKGQERIPWPAPPPPVFMKRGVKLFTDRQYVIEQMPDAVQDLPFHRTSTEKTDVTVTKPGTLLALTPTIRPKAASQEAALQAAGFTKVDVPEVQLFPGEINRVSLYRKTVKPGERFQFKKKAGAADLRRRRGLHGPRQRRRGDITPRIDIVAHTGMRA